MTAHREPGSFLKALVLHLDIEDRRRWYAHLTTAEREARSLRRGVFLMAVLVLASVAGLSYCALLLPEVFRNRTHVLMRGLYALALGSLISQAAFVGYLLWHRASVTRLHKECRRRVLALAQSQLPLPASPGAAVPVPVPPAPDTDGNEPATPCTIPGAPGSSSAMTPGYG
jgi:hypothetical protein